MLDPLLRRLVEAMDELEAERELNPLIERHALPLATVIVGRKAPTHPKSPHTAQRQRTEARAIESPAPSSDRIPRLIGNLGRLFNSLQDMGNTFRKAMTLGKP